MAETKSTRVTVERDAICDPGPLGLSAFAFTTFLLSAHNAGWAPELVWVGPAIFCGGLVLLLAGMWEFMRNNVFGATAFSTYGGFWLSVGFFIVLALLGLIPPSISLTKSFGWLLVGLLFFHTYMTITAALVSAAIFVAFLFIEISVIFLVIGNFLPSTGWMIAGGYIGIIASCAAWYASFAMLFNITAKRLVLPLGNPLLNFTSSNTAGDVFVPLTEDP